MITVAEAKRIIADNITVKGSAHVDLNEAYSYRLAEDVFSAHDIPAYEQSAMDGYAIRFEKDLVAYTVQGVIPAGYTDHFALGDGKAARIFTGAPMPEGADTVVVQEKVALREQTDSILIEDESLRAGLNVRPIGSEIGKGQLALSKGTKLTAANIGFLGIIGQPVVAIVPPPKVALILTGDELRPPGTTLLRGQVFECNSYMLGAALKWAGITHFKLFYAQDDLAALTKVMATALEQSDIVVLTGGVSVGAYDFVVRAAGNCGIAQQFHKVKQKPGKPLYFGSKNGKLVFGLPGNPSSVLSCFYQYVLPAINKMMGNGFAGLPEQEASLTNAYAKPAGLTHFMRGTIDDRHQVTLLQGQESYKLTAFAHANCMVQFDEELTEAAKGDLVTIYNLPG